MDDIEDYETCAEHETAYLRASGCFDCKTSDANTAPIDLTALGLHDKAIRSIPKPMPEHDPRDGCDEHLTTFSMGGECPDCKPHMMRPRDARPYQFMPKRDAIPMAGETPDTFDAGEPSRKPMPETLAAEACIKLLSREAGFADWWSTLGGMGQAHYHDAMGDLIRARMVDFAEPAMSPGERAASEVEAELADIRAGHHADVVKTREAKRALHLLGYDGDTLAQLYEDIKRTAILGNAVSRELLRQDEADKRAMIGERR